MQAQSFFRSALSTFIQILIDLTIFNWFKRFVEPPSNLSFFWRVSTVRVVLFSGLVAKSLRVIQSDEALNLYTAYRIDYFSVLIKVKAFLALKPRLKIEKMCQSIISIIYS